MLIASRLPIFANVSTWIPTLALMPLTGSINTSPMRPVFNRYPARAMFSNGYPPDPFMTALLLPWLRVLYLACKRFAYRYILLTNSSQQGIQNTFRAGIDARSSWGPRMVIMGENNSAGELVDGGRTDELDTYNMLDDGSLVGLSDESDEQVLLDDLELHMMERGVLPVNILVTVDSLSRLFVQALCFPLVSNIMGGLLGSASQYNSYLRKWLGIAPGVTPEIDIKTWFKGLWVDWMSGYTAVGRRKARWMDSNSGILDELDPVWYRNLIGGGIYILIKDIMVLTYRYLRKRQSQQLRVKDLPFSEGVAKELIKSFPS